MKTHGNPSRISDKVVEYILTRDPMDFESLTVSSIAREFKMNRCYLSQRFKFDKKYTLHEYILMIKILRSLAVLELRGDDISIDELAKKMGFSSTDYFRRIFKQKIGITPGKYKNFIKKGKLKKIPEHKNLPPYIIL